MDLREDFRTNFERLGLAPGRVIVAVSGGPDSVALLELLAVDRASHHLDLVVCHVDHGIADDSGAAATLVASHAERHGLRLVRVNLGLGPAATETAARAARHDALEAVRVAECATCIMLGHHADDQAETVLMRLLRGSGPAGLAGMAARDGVLVRPLLPFRRGYLARYVRERNLAVWDDPANRDTRHLRSWMREELMPAVTARLPDLHDRLLGAQRDAAAHRRAWAGVLQQLPGLDTERNWGGISVAASVLAGYDSDLGTVLLRALARECGVTLGPARADAVLRLARAGRSGAQLPLGDRWLATVSFGRLHLLPEPGAIPAPAALPAHGDLAQWGQWRIRLGAATAPAGQVRASGDAWLRPGTFRVRAVAPGDRLRPLGGVGHRLVVRMLQEQRVPAVLRASWPIVERDGEPAWVPGVSLSGDATAPAGTEAVRLDATHERGAAPDGWAPDALDRL